MDDLDELVHETLKILYEVYPYEIDFINYRRRKKWDSRIAALVEKKLDDEGLIERPHADHNIKISTTGINIMKSGGYLVSILKEMVADNENKVKKKIESNKLWNEAKLARWQVKFYPWHIIISILAFAVSIIAIIISIISVN